MSGVKLKSANRILLLFESNEEDEIKMSEIGEVINSVQENIGEDITIIWENRINSKPKTEIKINAIFTGEFEY